MTILVNFAKSVNLRPKLSTLLVFILLTLCFWWFTVNFISPMDGFGDEEAKIFRTLNLTAAKKAPPIYSNKKKGQIFSKSTKESGVNLDREYEELECKFARLDPWDPSILQYVYHPRSIECPQRQYNLTYISYNGTLNLNTTQLDLYLKNHDLKLQDINCTYSTYDRHPTAHDDRKSHYYQEGYISPHRPVILDTEFVETKCELKKNRTEIYFNIHAHPLSKKPNRTFAKHGDKKIDEDQLSVLMLMLDSTSVSVLKRHLIKTYDYIKNVMKFKIFNGFSKVGDNSFPNMIAALTGYRYQFEQSNMPPDITEDIYKINFDHWPLVWKLFAGKGYATIFNEDKAEWGLFHYMAKGFKDKPVDYFYFTYWYTIYLREYYSKISDQYCFQGVPKVQRLLDIVERHLVSMNDTLQFQYAFLTDLCHEYQGSEEERADEFVYDFLRRMYESGYFNRTAILFFGDHGHRYSPVRSTLVGLLEERTPMFNIWFPEWFYKKYPLIERNLDLNTMRLSSLFDVHQTLIDLARARFRDGGGQRPFGSRGYSQLYPIPKNRTCFEAGVPDHHCTCLAMTPLDVQSKEVQRAAFILLDHLNNHLLANYTSICSNFTMKKVIRAERLNINRKLAKGVKNYEESLRDRQTMEALMNATSDNETMSSSSIVTSGDFKSLDEIRVAVEVEPMSAWFEATIEFLEKSDLYVVQGDVSRLNEFGRQSFCAPKKSLQKFCVCRDFLAEAKTSGK